MLVIQTHSLHSNTSCNRIVFHRLIRRAPPRRARIWPLLRRSVRAARELRLRLPRPRHRAIAPFRLSGSGTQSVWQRNRKSRGDRSLVRASLGAPPVHRHGRRNPRGGRVLACDGSERSPQYVMSKFERSSGTERNPGCSTAQPLAGPRCAGPGDTGTDYVTTERSGDIKRFFRQGLHNGVEHGRDSGKGL